MAFETEIAKVSWAVADRRDIDKINNPMSTAELAAYAPRARLERMVRRRGHRAAEAHHRQREHRGPRLAALYAKTPLDTLKLWQQFHVADQAVALSVEAFVDSRFEFTKTLTGVTEQRPRWKRGLALVDGSLGELVGETYVEQYFPASREGEDGRRWSPI